MKHEMDKNYDKIRAYKNIFSIQNIQFDFFLETFEPDFGKSCREVC